MDFGVFRKYESIDSIKRGSIETSSVATWVAEEKIHGANFSIWYDGTTTRLAKRTDWLPDKPEFYDCLVAVEKVTPAIQRLWKSRFESSGVGHIQVYGELFGGRYIHPEVPPIKGLRHVQKEVQYSPSIEFWAFDVRINNKYPSITVEEKHRLFDLAGLPHPKILHVGTIRQLVELSPVFPTTIPEILGYPPIPKNEAEGYVLRPADGRHLLYKHKNPRFTEKKPPRPASGELNRLKEEVRSMITLGRIVTAKSKMDYRRKEDDKECSALVSEDIQSEYTVEIKERLSKMSEEERDKIKRVIYGSCMHLLRKSADAVLS